MCKKTLNELSQIARMNEDQALTIILSTNFAAIVKNKAMPLSEMIPSSIWQKYSQSRRGFIGKVFCRLHKELGFKFGGKGKSGTTNLYLLVN
ncbi:hypothetical protein [Paraglaciecola hydrolytica]|uniref:Uncharacterized protein n=1 Tax=Paraglaciecola hydrolytica TaxID=1799789 RepID=A0A148KLR8_9ALTE|nr:hypothetical protein [Paraglaciecola hydrolytica]KXI27209.1 hypothetical protein AX660_01180 [Paraglaciecola hydrolytica]